MYLPPSSLFHSIGQEVHFSANFMLFEHSSVYIFEGTQKMMPSASFFLFEIAMVFVVFCDSQWIFLLLSVYM